MQYVTNGQKIYATHCQNCHGSKGEGLGMLYPPLTDKSRLNQIRSILPCIVNQGQKGKIIVHQKTYNSPMPGFPEMPEIDIAYVLSFITIQFGDSKEHYSIDDVSESLKACK